MQPNQNRMKIDYGEWLAQHETEVLQSAINAIDPTLLDYSEFISLGGAIKSAGFPFEAWDAIGKKDANRYKGTLDKKWAGLRGEGKHGRAGRGTIYELAQRSGWHWPAPGSDTAGGTSDQASVSQRASVPDNYITTAWKDDTVFTIKCLIDAVPYQKKPENVWEIRNREEVPTPDAGTWTIQEFASAVASGHTFYPTVYSKEKGPDGRYTYRAKEQQIFVVDIDNEESFTDQTGARVKHCIENPLSVDDALDICRREGVMPFFVYETFSSKYHRDDPEKPYKKFRLCFATSEPVTVQKYGEQGIDAAIKYFIGLFGPAADTATTDYARMIFGTDERDTSQLLRAMIDRDKLIARMYAPSDQQAQEDTQAEIQEEQKELTGPEWVDAFLAEVRTTKYEPIPTGISDLDWALGGGFMRQWLILLGAPPGAGKTALAQMLFEGMAKRGTKCLYVNLEMSPQQLLARSISRIAASNGDKLTTLDVLQGYKWTYEQEEAVMIAAAEYKRDIAPRMVYNTPENVKSNIDNIIEYANKEAEKAEAVGDPAPLLVLDYLQVVTGDDREDAVHLIQRSVSMLKNYAIKHNTIVFAIMANNRISNKSGVTTMESGRDTSNLEYGADLMLGLDFTECLPNELLGTEGKKLTELTKEEKKYRTLKINKARFADTGAGVDFVFNGQSMTFDLRESRYNDDDWTVRE